MESTIYSVRESRGVLPKLIYEMPASAQPKNIYVAGKLPPHDALIVSVVGSRKASSYGIDAASEVCRVLAENNVVIASGLAVGIDSAAHKSALKYGAPTVAVLGSGISFDVMYPKENIELAKRIIESGGAVISEYEPPQKPELWTFPQRNRIIAGIAEATIVVEANAKSGALITARFALDYNRGVLCVPGQIFSDRSQGTNNLIKLGAAPITSIDELPELLGIKPAARREIKDILSGDEKKILEVLTDSMPIDEIIKESAMDATKVLSAISSLEIHGIIKPLGGGLYRKLS